MFVQQDLPYGNFGLHCMLIIESSNFLGMVCATVYDDEPSKMFQMDFLVMHDTNVCTVAQ
jgi:hypothetical protein